VRSPCFKTSPLLSRRRGFSLCYTPGAIMNGLGFEKIVVFNPAFETKCTF
jgi:hypothetical protein